MKKTNIIATVGPSSANIQELTKMVQNGVNIFRVNFSHGTYETHKETLELLHEARKTIKKPFSIMVDTRGPEIRLGTFENGSVQLKKGQTFTFYKKEMVGNETGVSLSKANILNHITVGAEFLANDGLMRFKVTSVNKEEMVTKVLTDGKLSNRKNLTFLNVSMGLPYISKEDQEDIVQAVKIGADMIACSFMSNIHDVEDMRNLLQENNSDMKIIAKIEGQEAIDNLDVIVQNVDAVMVARGDLGVELPFEKLPIFQEHIVSTTKKYNKPCIVATEMLESMIHSLRPTRAEITDLYNAVRQGAWGVMLSAESATGDHPAHTVKVMSTIVTEAEKYYAG